MIGQEYRGEMVRLVRTVLEEIGPRAFLGFIPIAVGLYLGAAARCWAAPGLAALFAAGALDGRSGDGV
jgi:hypothetical protein